VGDLWLHYKQRVEELKKEGKLNETDAEHDVMNLQGKGACGQVLDELKLHRYCCRRMLLTHVDIVDATTF
jgi:DNA-directed RNA polymerase subunit N (RpoN/RPB10)